MEEVAAHINEYIRLHENFLKMLTIQNSLFGNSVPGILAPARKFIHEGRLMKVRKKVVAYLEIVAYCSLFGGGWGGGAL